MSLILLVDDDPGLRKAVGRQLASYGHEIISAQDGDAALVVLRERKPDLILSDVDMPNMGGIQLSAWCKKLYPHVRMVLWTGGDAAKANRLTGRAVYLKGSAGLIESILEKEL
jgi:CheY-like chemotaxis protein